MVLEVPTDAPELTAGALVVGPEQAVEQLSRCDVLVRSPGVSIHRPEVCKLRVAGLPTVTPTGLWLAERTGQRVLGVTATKGKSTTATLAVHLARAAGVEARLVGNIGTPALDLLDEPSDVPVVAELSSYRSDLAVGPEVAAVSTLSRAPELAPDVRDISRGQAASAPAAWGALLRSQRWIADHHVRRVRLS